MFRRLMRALLGRGRSQVVPSVGAVTLPTLAEVGSRARSFPADVAKAVVGGGSLPPAEVLDTHPEAIAALQRGLEEWERGGATGLCFVGPRGSGMSTLLKASYELAQRVGERGDEAVFPPVFISNESRVREERELIAFLVAALALPASIDTSEALIAALVTGQPRIILIEDLQDFFLRTVGGGAAFEALLSIVAATSFRCLWISSCRQQAERILEHQFGVSQYFPHRIAVRLSDPKALQQMVHAWNAGLPRPVRFGSGEGIAEPEAHYLETLWELAAGNPMASRLFWLDSIRYAEEDDHVVLEPLIVPDLEYVRTLDRERLFALLSVFQHGGLAIDEHAEIYLTDPRTSRRVLDSLVYIGLLDPLGGGKHADHYDVNPAADAALVKLLEELNLIY